MNRQLMLLVVASALAPRSLPAQEAKAAAKAASPDEQLEGAKPGAEHERLARYAGAWDLEVTMGPGGAAMVYRGAADGRMIVGGRFLEIEYRAKGKEDALEGVFVIGFDRRHQRFELTAFDSFGTYSVASRGKRDEATGRIRMLGTDDDPTMKAMGFTKEFVHVLDPRSPDEFAIEVWFVDTRTPERREIKFMVYTFKRRN